MNNEKVRTLARIAHEKREKFRKMDADTSIEYMVAKVELFNANADFSNALQSQGGY